MNHLIVQLSPHEMNNFYTNLSYIKLTQNNQEENTFRQEIISSRLRILFLELIERLHQNRKSEPENQLPVKPRRSLVTNNFLQLVMNNCSAQRQVNWYASKLCIIFVFIERLSTENAYICCAY